MLFSDYLDQRGIILFLIFLFAILASMVLQKYKFNKKSISISGFLAATMFLGFMCFGMFLDTSKISSNDKNEIQTVLDRYNTHKNLFINYDYMDIVSNLETVISKKNATYKDLGKTGYADFRDQINTKLYHSYRYS